MVIIRKACFSCYKRGNIVIIKRASLCIKNVPGFIKNKERLKKNVIGITRQVNYCKTQHKAFVLSCSM